MRNTIIGLAVGLSISAAFAGDLTLTPSNLFKLIETEQKVSLNHTERIRELERKVAGMQKQITILHAKKADK